MSVYYVTEENILGIIFVQVHKLRRKGSTSLKRPEFNRLAIMFSILCRTSDINPLELFCFTTLSFELHRYQIIWTFKSSEFCIVVGECHSDFKLTIMLVIRWYFVAYQIV
jgi:hypothetical protein